MKSMWRVERGDVIEVLADEPDNSYDGCFCDPPYGLGKEPDMAEVLRHWLAGDDFAGSRGFMGKSWDGFVPGPATWKEVYRVLKPGATLLAFAGTRTVDMLSVSLRLAGFVKFDEIDHFYGGLPPQISWIQGQGFPKSKRLDESANQCLPQGAVCQCDASMRNNGRTYPLPCVVARICKAGTWGAGVHDVSSNALNGSHRFASSRGDCLPLRYSCDESLRPFARGVLKVVLPQEYAQAHNRWSEHEDDQGDVSLHSLCLALCNDLPSMRDYLTPVGGQHASQLLEVCADDRCPEADLSMYVSNMVGSLDVPAWMDADISACHKPHICSLVVCLPLSLLRILCDHQAHIIIPQSDYCVQCGGIRNHFTGYGTGLKPAHEIILCFRKPREGSFAANALKWGVAGLNVDGSRIGTDTVQTRRVVPNANMHHNYGGECKSSGIKTEHSGRWPANLLLSHSPGCERRGTKRVRGGRDSNTQRQKRIAPTYKFNNEMSKWDPDKHIAPNGYADPDGLETVGDWECAEGCPVKMLDEQSGELKSGTLKSDCYTNKDRPNVSVFAGAGVFTHRGYKNDKGGASRFFRTFEGEAPRRFRYVPKSSRRERDAGLEGMPPMSGGQATNRKDGSAGLRNPRAGAERTGGMRNPHPTCKPLKLCEYLARLILPPAEYQDGAQLLVPFAGVMSEAIGALLAGWRNITAIELVEEYCEIGEARMIWWAWAAEMQEKGMPDPRAILRTKPKKKQDLQGRLL